MKALSQETPETRRDILEYLDDCPLYDSVCVNDKNFVLVHSGLGNYSPNKRIGDYSMDELLWERPQFNAEYDPQKYIVIFGHTPTVFYSEQYKNCMIKTSSWWDIDTGAALENGRPMLLCLNSNKEYYINDDGLVIER